MNRDQAIQLLTSDDPADREVWKERVGRELPLPSLAGANLSFNDLSGYDLTGLDLSHADIRETNLREAILERVVFDYADLSGSEAPSARFAGARFDGTILNRVVLNHSKGLEGVDFSTAKIRDLEAMGVDFSACILTGPSIDLDGTEFSRACFDGADLTDATLVGAVLTDASFREAKLPGATLANADASGAVFYDADLENAVLQDVVETPNGTKESRCIEGVSVPQFAGSRLVGVHLPVLLAEFKDTFATVQRASDYTRKIYLALLLGAAYTLLTVGTTTPAELLSNTKDASLPILNSPIRVAWFLAASPVVLSTVYVYFQLSLRGIWLRIVDLPAVLPDGRDVDKAIDPWLLLGLVQRHFVHLKSKSTNGPERLQYGITVILAWIVVPATVLVCWLFSLQAHQSGLSTIQLGMFSISTVAAAVSFFDSQWILSRGSSRLGSDEMHTESVPNAQHISLAILMVVLAAAFFVQTLVVRGDLHFPWFEANLRSADLAGLNLSDARLQHADLVGTDLSGARLVGAVLSYADLRGTVLVGADLSGAKLNGARLDGANFGCANLSGVNGIDCQELENISGGGSVWSSQPQCPQIKNSAPPPECAPGQVTTDRSSSEVKESACCGDEIVVVSASDATLSDTRRSSGVAWGGWILAALVFGTLAVAAAVWARINKTRAWVSGTMSVLSGLSFSFALLDEFNVEKLFYFDDSSHAYYEGSTIKSVSNGLELITEIHGFPPAAAELEGEAIAQVDDLLDQLSERESQCLVLIGRTSRRKLGPKAIERFDSNSELAHARADWLRSRLEASNPAMQKTMILTLVGGAADRRVMASGALAESNRRVDVYACRSTPG